MRKKFVLCAIVISLSLLLAACPPINATPSASTSATPTELPTTVQVSLTATIVSAQVPETPMPSVTEVKIQVRGVGIAPKDEADPARRKRAAIRAAELEADRIFAQWQAGVVLDSVTISKDNVVDEDTIRETMKASLRMLRNTIEEHFDNATGEAEIIVEYIAEVAK